MWLSFPNGIILFLSGTSEWRRGSSWRGRRRRRDVGHVFLLSCSFCITGWIMLGCGERLVYRTKLVSSDPDRRCSAQTQSC